LRARPMTRTTAGVMRTARGAPTMRAARPQTASQRRAARKRRELFFCAVLPRLRKSPPSEPGRAAGGLG
jgi:hypothetical protein